MSNPLFRAYRHRSWGHSARQQKRLRSQRASPSVRTVVLPDFAVQALCRRRESRRRPPDAQGDLAARQQRRAAVPPDPAGHRLGVGDPAHLPQDRRDADLRAGELRDCLSATRPLLPHDHPGVLPRKADDRGRRRPRPAELSDPSGSEDDSNTWGISGNSAFELRKRNRL